MRTKTLNQIAQEAAKVSTQNRQSGRLLAFVISTMALLPGHMTGFHKCFLTNKHGSR